LTVSDENRATRHEVGFPGLVMEFAAAVGGSRPAGKQWYC